jgi:hypothetical protein
MRTILAEQIGPADILRHWCPAVRAVCDGAATVLVDKKDAACEAVDAVLGYSTDRRTVSIRMSTRW